MGFIGLHCNYCDKGPCTNDCVNDTKMSTEEIMAYVKDATRYIEVDGCLISMAKEGKFDVIAHGCNCFCTMAAGIAPQMDKAFGCGNFKLERKDDEVSYYGEGNGDWSIIKALNDNKGDINKLGNIDYKKVVYSTTLKHIIGGYSCPKPADLLEFYVVNAYTQYRYGVNHKDGVSKPVDYEAITMVMRKMNVVFKGLKIGLPKIGAGLAGGDWNRIRNIIQTELKDCQVVVVNYKK